MRFVIQRVQHAECVVDGKTTGAIGKGFLVLIGISDTDTEEIADRMLKKMTGLRIFEDQEGKTNLSLGDVGGGLLLVSQFTLYADCKKETGRLSSGQETRKWPNHFMNTLFWKAGNTLSM